MDYPAIDFEKWGQLLITIGNFKGLIFRKIPYIISPPPPKKRKKNPIVMPIFPFRSPVIDIVVFLYFPFVV